VTQAAAAAHVGGGAPLQQAIVHRFRNRMTLTFDLLTPRPTHATEHMCTKYGVDSSSGFSFPARTHTDMKSQMPIYVLAVLAIANRDVKL